MLSPGEFFTVCCLGAKAALMAQAVDTDALRLRPAPITVRVGTVGNTGRQLPVLLATSGRVLTEGNWRGCLLAGCEDPRTVQAATDGVASTFTTRRAACHRDDQSGKGAFSSKRHVDGRPHLHTSRRRANDATAALQRCHVDALTTASFDPGCRGMVLRQRDCISQTA